MTYFNPKIYNYSNLKKEDQKIIDIILMTMDNCLHVEKFEDDITIFEKMKNEIAEAAVREIKDNIYKFIISLIVSTIDAYEETYEITEKETTSFLYGYK